MNGVRTPSGSGGNPASEREGMEKTEVRIASAGTKLAAWLYRPEGSGPHPCVVLGHGFGAIREMRLDAYAERFARAGLAAVAFDYRHLGASGGEPRQLFDLGRQLEDWRAAVGYARSLDGVDPERIALWGTSFGSGYVLQVAATDARIAAAVAQCPMIDMLRFTRNFTPAQLARLMVAAVRDELRGLRGAAPYYIGIVGRPGSLSIMNTEGAEEGLYAMVPPGVRWTNEATPRVALRVGFHRPVKLARRIRCPVLFVICDEDELADPAIALEAAAAAAASEVRHYPVGHFGIYLGEAFERAVADQVEFLTRHLLDQDPAASIGAGAA